MSQCSIDTRLTPAGAAGAAQEHTGNISDNPIASTVDVEARRSSFGADEPGLVGFANFQSEDEFFRIVPALHAPASYVLLKKAKRIDKIWDQLRTAKRGRDYRLAAKLAMKLEKKMSSFQKFLCQRQQINTFAVPKEWILKTCRQVAKQKLGDETSFLSEEAQDWANYHGMDNFDVLARGIMESDRVRFFLDWSRADDVKDGGLSYTSYFNVSIGMIKLCIVLLATLLLVCVPVMVYSLKIITSSTAIVMLYGLIVVLCCLLFHPIFKFDTFVMVTIGLAALLGQCIARS
ncbi:hypothetical protein PT974_06861 [Cladobotryum mycophilum]|uniref:DUF6594 domain-containing protein n=1 Tax=Cladobotryum mycophilum TaxID=491253 RepID=A0ABR0SMN1_9HYPO